MLTQLKDSLLLTRALCTPRATGGCLCHALLLFPLPAYKQRSLFEDQTLILADQAEKAITQVRAGVRELLGERLSAQQAEKLASLLSEGTWTHDYPLSFQMARELGLPVSNTMPAEILELMKLFPQPMRRTPSVEYLPVPRRSEGQKTNGND